MRLLIVESPAKAKTISGYLGSGWMVRASFGHIRDLPKRELGVDPDQGMALTYVPVEGKERAVQALREAYAKADEVYLAPDPDREGEAIAWHVAEMLGIPEQRRQRVTFTEITKTAIQAAVQHPRRIDSSLVDAQQARRVIDRLMGYTLSPLLSGWVGGRLSAGRVQSAGLALIVEREREIRAFVPEEYWNIFTHLEGVDHRDQPFRAKLVRVGERKLDKLSINTKDQADKLKAALERASYSIRDVTRDESRRNPPPPFVTSTLQQEAARKLGFSAEKTMQVAQELYQGVELGDEGAVGIITYMRTDSVNLSDEALSQIGAYVRERFGDDYALDQPRTYTTKAKNAQEAHEAIRPTSVRREPDAIAQHLTADQAALYRLIWLRAVATQMASAVYDTMVVEVDGRLAEDTNTAHFGLEARGRALKFDGFLAVYEEGTDDEGDEEDEEGGLLPPVVAGEGCDLLEVETQQSTTKPPPRYTEASFVKELERRGVGRPSTYATIVSTIIKRGYVEVVKKKLIPTELGETVVEILEKNFPDVVDSGFTARMEGDLDGIAAGEKDWVEFTAAWWKPFKAQADLKAQTIERGAYEKKADRPCPLCGSDLVLRRSTKGAFYACKGYPECKYAIDADATRTDEPCPACGEGKLLERVGKGRRKLLACELYPKCQYRRRKTDKRTDRQCPECGKGALLEKKAKSGNKFYGCEMFPECRYTEPEGGPPQQTDEPCPACGQANLVIRQGKYGPFAACPRYPECTYIKSDRPPAEKTGEKCPECKKGELVVRQGKKGPFTACDNYPECRYIKSDRPPAEKTGEKCPECGEGELVIRQGKKGPFAGCSNFPKCRYIKSDRKEATTGVVCPTCEKGELVERVGARGTFFSCNRYPACKTAFNDRPLPIKCAACGNQVVQTPGAAVCSNEQCRKPA